jgi:hypothetical protein
MPIFHNRTSIKTYPFSPDIHKFIEYETNYDVIAALWIEGVTSTLLPSPNLVTAR